MNTCPHGLTQPPECPECIRIERDKLWEQVQALHEALSAIIDANDTYGDVIGGRLLANAKQALASIKPDWSPCS